MAGDAVGSDGDILFGQFAAQIARNRALVQQWMTGAKETSSSFRNETLQGENDEGGVFELKPEYELAGIGANVQNLTEAEKARLDPELRYEDASTAFLHRQLLGKKTNGTRNLTKLTGAATLPGVYISFNPSRAKSAVGSDATQGTTTVAPLPAGKALVSAEYYDDDEEEEKEEDEEIGRSGVGQPTARHKNSYKGKRNATRFTDPISAMKQDTGPVGDLIDSDGSDIGNDTRSEKTASQASASPAKSSRKKMSSYLDELLAQKSAKRKKKTQGL